MKQLQFVLIIQQHFFSVYTCNISLSDSSKNDKKSHYVMARKFFSPSLPLSLPIFSPDRFVFYSGNKLASTFTARPVWLSGRRFCIPADSMSHWSTHRLILLSCTRHGNTVLPGDYIKGSRRRARALNDVYFRLPFSALLPLRFAGDGTLIGAERVFDSLDVPPLPLRSNS